ncbi:MAG TPA: tyrosine--tRNA ligase, partial [Cyanobacteria bacterium UBA11368]|nr:tyrosine--tRNA ligase [Cyanobacteria bacterium UBA11368]
KVPDNLLEQYIELLPDLALDRLPEKPRDRQKLLASEIVSQYHGQQAAQEAEKATESQSLPEFSVSAVQFPAKLVNLLGASKLCSSNRESREKIQAGAVRLDGEKITDINVSFDTAESLDGRILQVGKSKFVRLIA